MKLILNHPPSRLVMMVLLIVILNFLSVKADTCIKVGEFCNFYNEANEVYSAILIRKEISGPRWLYVFNVTEVLKGKAMRTVQAQAVRNGSFCLPEINLEVGASYLICVGHHKGVTRLIGGDRYAAIPLSKATSELELLRKLKSQKKSMIQPCAAL